MEKINIYTSLHKELVEIQQENDRDKYVTILMNYERKIKTITDQTIIDQNMLCLIKKQLNKMINDPEDDIIKNSIESVIFDTWTVCQSLNGSNIDIDTILQDINKNDVMSCKYLVDASISYEKREILFEKLIKEKIKYELEMDEIIYLIDIFIVILRLPFVMKNNYKTAEWIYLSFYCSFSGNPQKRNSKGVGCTFGYNVKIEKSGNVSVNKSSHTEIQNCDCQKRNHQSGFVTSFWLLPITNVERQRIELLFKLGLDENQIQFIHKELILTSDQYRSIKKNINTKDHPDSLILQEPLVETMDKLMIVNKMNSIDFHSLIIINKNISEMSYSRYIWFTDTTLFLTIYNFHFQLICTIDSFNKTQILGYFLIPNEQEETFTSIFEQVKLVLKYSPSIIVVDRGITQQAALSKVFTESRILYCQLHIKRNIHKHFGGTIVELLFNNLFENKISFNLFQKYIEIILNNAQCEDNEELIEDVLYDTESVEFSGDIEEFVEKVMKQFENDETGVHRQHVQTGVIKEDEVKSFILKKGKKSIQQLLNHKERWVPELTVGLGIYRNTTSNRVEGIFGIIKRLLNHKKCTLVELLNFMESFSKILLNRFDVESISCDSIIDKSDPRFDNLNVYCIRILNKQYQKAIESVQSKQKQDTSKCRSCLIRSKNVKCSWPCYHLMRTKILRNCQFCVDYDEIPTRGWKPVRTRNLFQTEAILKDYTIELNDKLMNTVNGIKYYKQKHQTNAHQRTAVDKKRSKQVTVNEEFGEVKRKRRKPEKPSEPFHQKKR